MSVQIVTVATAARYAEWYARALHDDTVWPYITINPHSEAIEIKNDDWQGIVLMDDPQSRAVLTFHPYRNQGGRSASVSLWVLAGDARLLTASLMMREVPKLAHRYGVRFLDTICHASNEASRNLMIRHFGEPWGIKPEGAWNGLLGHYEDAVHFRCDLARPDIQKRFADAA